MYIFVNAERFAVTYNEFAFTFSTILDFPVCLNMAVRISGGVLSSVILDVSQASVDQV